MIEVSEYNPATGEIGLRLAFQNEEAFDLNRRDGFEYIDGEYDGAHYYVADLAAVERPPSPVTLSDLTLQGVRRDRR